MPEQQINKNYATIIATVDGKCRCRGSSISVFLLLKSAPSPRKVTKVFLVNIPSIMLITLNKPPENKRGMKEKLKVYSKRIKKENKNNPKKILVAMYI